MNDIRDASWRARLTRSPWRIGVIVLLSLVALLLVGQRLAAEVLRDRVLEALGPSAAIGRVTLGLDRVVIEDLRLHAPEGWPAPDALRAARVVLYPDLRTLFSATTRVDTVEVEQAYLSVWRTQDEGLRLLPDLLHERRLDELREAAPRAVLDSIRFEDGVIELFDGSVRQPPHRLRLNAVRVEVGELRVPTLDGRTSLRLDGTLGDREVPGRVTVEGWIEPMAGNSSFESQLQRVDLKLLEPYLIRDSETGVRGGTLDLQVRSTVTDQRLKAPGTLVLEDLELEPAGGLGATFMGLSRQAVIATMKNRDRRIELDFTLEGALDDPRFSLNEVLSIRLAVGIARTLGLSLEGVVRGIGDLGGQGLKAVGGAIEEVGDWIVGDDDEEEKQQPDAR
ncbi:MAG TPA: DUF748 domain-containing protein [Solimonas sp.]